jgi:hypothetical protein
VSFLAQSLRQSDSQARIRKTIAIEIKARPSVFSFGITHIAFSSTVVPSDNQVAEQMA